jgi:hypothetical protein
VSLSESTSHGQTAPRTKAEEPNQTGIMAATPPAGPAKAVQVPKLSSLESPGLAAQEIRPLPGLEVVGRGIFLRPYQPYSLGQLLFKRDQHRTISSKETKETYAIPVGYEVNDSPPFPMNESLNQVVIEESWERFEKQMNLDANVALSSTAFSISATSTWNSRLRAEQEAYYAVRSSFVPLWSVYVPNPNECIGELCDPDIPVPFSHRHRRAYDEFFRCYGSHYVRAAWVGGKSMLIFTVLKSSQLNKEDIQAGIKASFGGSSGGVNAKQEQSREKLRSSSQCTVVGKGGDEVQLAAMSSLDQDAYNAWLKTIPLNPQAIELDVAGIWTLVKNEEKAEALLEAYRELVTFDPMKAVFDVGADLFFVRGSQYVRYDRKKKVTEPPKAIVELFPGLADEGFERLDEAFRGRRLRSPDGQKLDRKLFLFRQDRFVRFDIDNMKIDEGYPKLISEEFPGMPFKRIDAALIAESDAVYFFYGNQYVRFNPQTNRVDDGYPQPIAKRWVGVTFDRLDAAVYWGSSKVYFFKGDQHIRYDLANFRADPGYPKHIIGNYVADWKFVDE